MRRKSAAGRIALAGVLGALALTFFFLGELLVVGTVAAPLLASLLLIPARRECGARHAWLLWGAVSLLALLLTADKEAAGLFLLLGCYPLLRPAFQRIGSRPLRALAKLLLFYAALALLYAVLLRLLAPALLAAEFAGASHGGLILLLLLATAVGVLFDLLIPRFELLCERRLPRITGGR